MRCDEFRFLLIKTTKEGAVFVIASSDNEEEIGEAYLFHNRIYEEEIKAGLFRYDMYKEY